MKKTNFFFATLQSDKLLLGQSRSIQSWLNALLAARTTRPHQGSMFYNIAASNYLAQVSEQPQIIGE